MSQECGLPWEGRSLSILRMPFTDRSLESIRQDAEAFATERDWEQFHTVRNLLLALVSEVGELAEVVRWQGDAEPTIAPERRQDWNDEIADVFILLVRLADRSGVDLPAAFASKLARAGEKYPVERFKGSSRKYNEEKKADN
jgi:NTP pyrophosphatase (non-canonical NTP hydrolase)